MEIYSKKMNPKYTIIEWIITLLINAFAIFLAAKIFKGFYISSYLYAIIAAIIINILNKTIKPFLKILALPITIITLGILYPLVDTIILKITSLLMGSAFILEGWFIPFIVSIFISSLTLILDATITKIIIGGQS